MIHCVKEVLQGCVTGVIITVEVITFDTTVNNKAKIQDKEAILSGEKRLG